MRGQWCEQLEHKLSSGHTGPFFPLAKIEFYGAGNSAAALTGLAFPV